MRVLVCGKGGSGKSSILTLMARALECKVNSDAMAHQMTKALVERRVGILGLVHHDPEVAKAGLAGTRLGPCGAANEVRDIVERFEAVVGQNPAMAGGGS
jgi:CO dehydrogenase nickel-insertion accessory protein CooC1